MARPIVVYDLDDTLYLERDFAYSGYRAVEAELGIPGFSATCRTLLDGGQRTAIFDAALARHGVPIAEDTIARLVTVYRTHAPDIAFCPDAARHLAARAPDEPGALITDGPLAMQQGKVRALGLDRILGCVVCTAALGPGLGKPHPRPYEVVEDWAARYGRPLLYVADNPLKDFVTPRARGWLTVRIARPERVHHVEAPTPAHEAHAVIESFDGFEKALDRIGAVI
jgi:putative hydrolase of the HAD superfamily